MTELILRPYQRSALTASKQKYDAGFTRQLIVLPTGTGKTVLFSHLLQHHKIDKRLLVLVHRKELVEQAKKHLKKCNPNYKVGEERGSISSWSEDRFVVASVQSIGRKGIEKLLSRFPPEDFGAIVCDEAHHATSDTYRRIFGHFKIHEPGSKILLLGVTATPFRSDGDDIQGIFHELVYSMPILQAIQEGWLVDLRASRVQSHVSLDRIPTRAGDFAVKELERAVNTVARNEMIVKSWLERCEERQTVVFCVDIQHGKDLAAAFQAVNISAACVWGNDPDRDQKVRRHKCGEIMVLTNCGVLTEGYDDWKIACVILARPTMSRLLFMQMIGRGTRIEEGIDNLIATRERGGSLKKEDCIVLDVVDNTEKHRLVVTLATLLGYPPHHDFRGKRLSEEKYIPMRTGEGSAEQILQTAGMIRTTVEEIDLFSPPHWSDERLNKSVLQWFRTGDRLICPLPDGGHVVIEGVAGWVVYGKVDGKLFGKPDFSSFVEAIAYGEKMLKHLGTDLLREIEAEDKESHGKLSGLQEKLLRSTGKHNWTGATSRQAAAELIAAAFEAELSAHRVSGIGTGSELYTAAVPSSVEIRAVESGERYIFPHVWSNDLMNRSLLRWFKADDGGYIMPLPENGEFIVLPEGAGWVLRGEASGVKLAVSEFDTSEAAFEHLDRVLEVVAPDLLAEIRTEDGWTSLYPTPILLALLNNLRSSVIQDSTLMKREMQQLVYSLYAYEYNHELNAFSQSEDPSEISNESNPVRPSRAKQLSENQKRADRIFAQHHHGS